MEVIQAHHFVIARQALTSKQVEEIETIGKQYNWKIRETKYLVIGHSTSDFNFFDYLKFKMGVDMEEVVYYSN